MSRAAGVRGATGSPDYHRVSQACQPVPVRDRANPQRVSGTRLPAAAWRRCACLNAVIARRAGTAGRFGQTKGMTELNQRRSGGSRGGRPQPTRRWTPLTPWSGELGGLQTTTLFASGGMCRWQMASPSQTSFFRARRKDSMSAASRKNPIGQNGGADGGNDGSRDGAEFRGNSLFELL